MTKRKTRRVQASLRVDELASTLCRLFDVLEGVQFWIKDQAGRYCWVNRGFLLNYSLQGSEQVLGKTDFELSPPHLADQYRLDDERVLRGESIDGRVELVGGSDHSARWSVTHKLPVRDARGKVKGSAGVTWALDARAVAADVQDEAISRVVAAVRENCAAAWTNRAMARSANLSVRAFERRFRNLYRISPQVYVRQLRVRMATRALVYHSRPLAEIAAEFGYADQSHFTREFRRETSMTPGQYRRKFGSR